MGFKSVCAQPLKLKIVTLGFLGCATLILVPKMSKRESQSAKCDHRPPDKYETLEDLFAQAMHYSEWSLREKGSAWPEHALAGR